ncbi:MAG: hypothetical protein ABSA97_07405 [Verrucomicrobiia bacterium]
MRTIATLIALVFWSLCFAVAALARAVMRRGIVALLLVCLLLTGCSSELARSTLNQPISKDREQARGYKQNTTGQPVPAMAPSDGGLAASIIAGATLMQMPVTPQMTNVIEHQPSYSLQWSFDLTNWIDVAQTPWTGQCPVVFVYDRCTNFDAGFYRLRYVK